MGTLKFHFYPKTGMATLIIRNTVEIYQGKKCGLQQSNMGLPEAHYLSFFLLRKSKGNGTTNSNKQTL